MQILRPLAFIAFFFIPSCCYSQEIEWQKTIGGSISDFLFSAFQTSDKGYFLAGHSYSPASGEKTENSLGNEDYWVVKLDSLRNIVWQNTIGGNNKDFLFTSIETSDGGFLLGGKSNSPISGDKTEDTLGLDDYWVVKIDNAGLIQWQNTIGGSGHESLNAVCAASDGGYILAGSSVSPISGDKTQGIIGGYDFWLIKLDSAGNIVWQNTIGDVATNWASSVSQTTDGGYIVGGYSGWSISKDDYTLAKVDVSGNLQWMINLGGSEIDRLTNALQTSDGGYILAGRSNSPVSGDKTEDSLGFSDYWIVKTDSAGSILWQKTIGGDSDDYSCSIKPTSQGGYIIAGTSYSSFSGKKHEPSDQYGDIWIVKIDGSGNELWQNNIGGISTDWALGPVIALDDGFIIGGSSSASISGDKTENSRGGCDYWLVKINDVHNNIAGTMFADFNSNGTVDPGEVPIKNKSVIEPTSGRFTFSQIDGNYTLAVLDSGWHQASVSNPMSYYNFQPLQYDVFFPSKLGVDSLNDFAMQPAGVYNDVCISISPNGPFRAGFNAQYTLSYSNLGTTALSPTVIFYPDNDVTFVSAIPSPTSVTPDSVVWSLGSMTPFQTGNINVTVNVNTGTPIGTLINSGVKIEPIAGDANTQCNQSYWEVFTTGSYDPNDILVDQDTLLSTQFPTPPYLDYIIRFQNTGNDTAFTVKVLNPIDTFALDLSSFEFVASSHPMNIRWISWERNMQFQFENILLPDSNVNEAASHGFIRYRIKPKSTLTAGDSISNFAAIYFDFNAPVITNTAVTEVVLPTGGEEIADGKYLKVFPNPAADKIKIAGSRRQAAGGGQWAVGGGQLGYEIYNMLGTVVLEGNISNENEIDINSIKEGVYLIRLHEGKDGEVRLGRFVKM